MINKKNESRLVSFFDKINRNDDVSESKSPISQKTIKTLESWELALTQYHNLHNDIDDNPIDAVIGFDFGTSSSKIIVRFPYEGEGGTSFAFPVPPEFRADEHPYCWNTMFFYEPSNRSISLGSFDKASPITDIKTSAMQDVKSPGMFASTMEPLDVDHITIAYIGLLLRAVKGWIFSDILPSMNVDLAKRKVLWQLNLGLPASTQENLNIYSSFLKISANAWEITRALQPCNMYDIWNIMHSYDERDNNIKFDIRPEVIAQTLGFIEAEIADFGFYVVADIGASTFDVCTFNYIEQDGEEKFNLFYSDVQLLGVRALSWLERVNSVYKKSFTKEDLNSDIRACIGNTVFTTKTHKAPNEEIWSNALSIFLCGGGKMSKIHLNSLDRFKSVYATQNNGTVEFKNVAVPQNLKFDCDLDDYHRLSVAWGLSIPYTDFNKYTLPSDIEDVPKQHNTDIGDRFTGSEQV